MDTTFSINLANVENEFVATYDEIDTNMTKLEDEFLGGGTYKQLKSSGILNFSGYIEGVKTSLFQIKKSTNNVKDFLNDVITDHKGIDNYLCELPFEILEDGTLQILNSIKKLSEYDNNYSEISDKPVIDFQSSFNILISKSDLKFDEVQAVGTDNISYDTSYQRYETEEELHFATPSSNVYE